MVSDTCEPDSLQPFDQLLDLSKIATHLAFSEPTPPRIHWNQDLTAVAEDGEWVYLSALRQGVQSQLEGLRSYIYDITGEKTIPDWLNNSLSSPIKEDPRNTTPGYSFLDHRCFKDAHLPALAHLLGNRRIGVVDHAGWFSFNAGAIQWFFKKTESIQHALMVLMRLFSNSRGTEMSDTKFQNSTSRRRNLNVILGQLYCIGAFTKTGNLTGHDSYLPCLLPKEFSQLVIYYLAAIHPMKSWSATTGMGIAVLPCIPPIFLWPLGHV